jgi:Trypsin-co-occurring domain 1
MATKLIQFEDGLLVEAEILGPPEAREISGGSAERVGAAFNDMFQPVLMKVCRPIISVWTELNKDLCVEKAEVELGLSFEGEGHLFLAKARAGATLNVKLILTPNAATAETAGRTMSS